MKRHLLFLLPFLLLTACKTTGVGTATQSSESKSWVAEDEVTAYIGTYTRSEGHVDGKAEGIYRIGLNPRTGEMGSKMTVSPTINPSFLRLSEDKQYLYAVSELAHADEPTGFIHAFRTGGKELIEISKLPTNGQAPCHVEIDKTGALLIASNYVGGVATAYSIRNDGTLEESSRFVVPVDPDNAPSWLHSANFSPDNKIVAIADKGRDKVWLNSLDQRTGQLVPHAQQFVQVEKGSGPRHAQWSADGRFLYVINELSNDVAVVARNPSRDRYNVIQTISTLPENYSGETSYCADLHLHPNGNFLYGSNRGHNSIAMFGVDKATGILTSLGQEPTRGTYPRNFSIDARGNFLYAANQNSSNITSYRIGADGRLAFTKEDFKIATPVCVEY